MKKIILSIAFALSFSLIVFSQNKFEGYNVILDAPETQKTGLCALRFAAPTTNITVADLDPSTPMKVKACDGSGAKLTQNGSTASLQASAATSKWCFEGEDKKYRISFRGDQFSGTMIYDWFPTPSARDAGFYNVRDFGAVGDGRTDDTIAIRSALAYMAMRNGGTLNFPQGDYLVGNVPDYKGIVIPTGVVIQGVSGTYSDAPTINPEKRSPSRINLAGTNRALFKIGECTDRVTIRDIELFAQSSENTYGFEAVGAFLSSQDFAFDRVSFSNFFRGIYGHALSVPLKIWQFDYIKVNQCRFIYNRDAGIYNDVSNSDWKIQGSVFINPKKQPGQNANSMHYERAAAILIQDTYSGGFTTAPGGTFLEIINTGLITIITSQCEQMTNSIVLNPEKIPGGGIYSYPITIINSEFYHPIIFNGRRPVVSIGSFYGPNTFQADYLTRIYSTGDRFCHDGLLVDNCSGAKRTFFDKATVVMMTGQPDERTLTGYPTYFGTDVNMGGVVQMSSIEQNKLPAGKPNGSMVYCQNCRRNTTPCQAGGAGAPAMVVGNQWSCL